MLKAFLGVVFCVVMLSACNQSDTLTLTTQAVPQIRLSDNTSGLPYTSLDGRTIKGSVYMYVPHQQYLNRIGWVLDGRGIDTDRSFPYSLRPDDQLVDTRNWSDGPHTLTARYFYKRGGRRWTESVSATFTVRNSTAPAKPEPPPTPTGKTIEAYVPWWQSQSGPETAKANPGVFTSQTLHWYVFGADGNPKLMTWAEPLSQAYLDSIRATGVKINISVTNQNNGSFSNSHFAGVASDPTKRANLINGLVNLTLSLNVDGIDVDFENISSTNRGLFESFVADLGAELMARGKTLTVVVYAKTSDSVWPAYNYAALAQHADDLMLMAYTHTWAGSTSSPRGPVSPLSWLRKVAAYATSRAPGDKYTLGLSNMGIDFVVGGVGKERQWGAVQTLIKTHGATVRHDTVDEYKWFAYYVNGESHEVYFDDAGTMAVKAGVVNEYGLKGMHFWRLHDEDPAMWGAVRGVLGQ